MAHASLRKFIWSCTLLFDPRAFLGQPWEPYFMLQMHLKWPLLYHILHLWFHKSLGMDHKSLFFVDFLINTIKILPCSTICGDMCICELILQGNCTMMQEHRQYSSECGGEGQLESTKCIFHVLKCFESLRERI